MFIDKKLLVSCSLLISICLLAVFTANNIPVLPASTSVTLQPKIILNAEHTRFRQYPTLKIIVQNTK